MKFLMIKKVVQDESLHVTQSMRVRVLYLMFHYDTGGGNQGGIADFMFVPNVLGTNFFCALKQTKRKYL